MQKHGLPCLRGLEGISDAEDGRRDTVDEEGSIRARGRWVEMARRRWCLRLGIGGGMEFLRSLLHTEEVLVS